MGKSTNIIRIINLVFLAVGLGALLWMVRTLGWTHVSETVASVRGWALPILGTSVAAVFLNSAAIHVFMRPEQRMVSYWRVLAAQLSGQAVNSVTPTGTLGEVVKATMLVGHAPRYRAVSSVIAYNITDIFITVFLLMFAIVVSLIDGRLPARLEWILVIALGILLVLSGGVLFVLRRGLMRSIAGSARRLHILSPERRVELAERLDGFDRQVKMFGPHREADYTAGFIYMGLARIIGWFDLWLILHALGYSQGFALTVTAAAAGMIINTVATIVPLGIGADEGGQAGLFALLGVGAVVGLAISLIRRVRTIAIAAVGLLVMFGVQLADQAHYRRSRNRLLERSPSSSR